MASIYDELRIMMALTKEDIERILRGQSAYDRVMQKNEPTVTNLPTGFFDILRMDAQKYLEDKGMNRSRARNLSEKVLGSENQVGALEFAPPYLIPKASEKLGMNYIAPAIQQAQEGNYLSGLGQLGAGAGMFALETGKVPSPVKSAAKAGVSKAKQLQNLISSFDTTGMSEADKMLLNTFGSKAERESKATKKVIAATKSGESLGSGSGGKYEKVAPDYFRKVQEQYGQEEALKQALAGKHLKPTESGYVGAPRTVTSPQSLGAMRSSIDTQFDNAANAIAASDDPSRVGTWYDRAKAAQALSNEPYQLPRSLEQHSVYSAGVAPEVELGFALKHLNSRALGVPEMAYRGAPMENLDSAVRENRPAKLAFKIGEYGAKNNPDIPNKGLFGVNDFRNAQFFGYTTPEGKPWRAGASATMHPFMDAETALAVKRANELGIGGRTDWGGSHLQEMPWVLNKAEDFYGRGFKAKYKNENIVEGMKQAIRDANNTFADYIPKHTMSATWEAIPGASLNHVPSLLNATPEQKLAYTKEGSWSIPVPTMPTKSGNIVGAGNRDALYSALGLRQMPAQETTGAYLNSLGQIENNPVNIANVLVDFKKGSHDVAPLTLNAMNAAEKFRAVVDAQEAGAANMLRTTQGTKGKTSVLLEGNQPTQEQISRVAEILKGTNLTPASNSRGISLLDFSGNSALTNKTLKQKGGLLSEVYPSVTKKGNLQSVYVAGLGRLDDSGKFIPSKEGSGQSTSDLLIELAKQPPEVSRKLSESEDVRKIIGEKIARDARIGGARADVQKTREFLKTADWNRAVELIRSGATPAAALATLGFSLQGMAQDGE